MAKLVLAIGTSHTPMLTLHSEDWEHRAAADYNNAALNLSDGRLLSYHELLTEVGPRYADSASAIELARKADICERALDQLAVALREASPDLVIIIGDDQDELFSLANNPAISIFYGSEILTHDKFARADMPAWMHAIGRGYGMDRVHVFPGAPDFAEELITGMLERNIDIAASVKVEDPRQRGFGHAVGFVITRLFAQRSIPVVPILINTYYPPNVPSAGRCHDVGKALRELINASPRDARVAVIASGGLSHFVVDEKLDRRVLEGLEPAKENLLRTIPRAALNSGSSEILNWIMMAGAIHGLSLNGLVYQPIYRTPAGTGVGVAFGSWGI